MKNTTKTKVYLDEAQDIVTLKNAVWEVETQYDSAGNVVREDWSRLLRVKRKVREAKASRRGKGRL